MNLVLNSRDRVGQTAYNAAQYNAKDQNIVQGHIDSVCVSEVNFPYDIPNIQAPYNTFLLSAVLEGAALGPRANSEPGLLTITIPSGFYTGPELVAAINLDISAQQVSVEAEPADAPTFAYDETNNLFTMLAPETTENNPTPTWGLFSPYTFNVGYVPANNNGKDILSIMGYTPDQSSLANPANFVSVDPTILRPAFVSNSAPLVFTQYIDICSPQLCKFQEFQGGSTAAANLARRADVICRLYVTNNASLSEPEGLRPFIINRQYYNARVMKWTAANSIGNIDINLYDDIGQPLQTFWQPRNYQITFNVYEGDRNDQNVGYRF